MESKLERFIHQNYLIIKLKLFKVLIIEFFKMLSDIIKIAFLGAMSTMIEFSLKSLV